MVNLYLLLLEKFKAFSQGVTERNSVTETKIQFKVDTGPISPWDQLGFITYWDLVRVEPIGSLGTKGLEPGLNS